LAQLRERGFLVFEGFLAADELAAAQEALWLHYPRPEEYFADEEISVTGPAGTLFSFRTDMVHRGSRMTAERSARFTLLAHYDVWGPRWTGRVAWPTNSLSADWGELIERATPRERSVFGFPAPGDPYWDEQTLADTQARYPRADLTPYR